MKTVTEGNTATKTSRINKGGRPKKSGHRDQKITVMCTRIEVITLRYYAKQNSLSLSEYLRTIALKRQVDSKAKALPKEVLQLTGTLNHLAANLNQIAYKRNRGEELNAIERATLMVLSAEVKELAKTFKAALK